MIEIRCPACGTSIAKGGSFQIVQPYKAAGIGFVEGLDDEGALVVEWVDRGDPSRMYAPELACVDCGHQWPTKRRVAL